MTLNFDVTEVFEWNYDAYGKYRTIINQGSSRCHAPGTLIRMFDGRLKPVEDIVIGDKVMNINGNGYNSVISLDSGTSPMYEVHQGKGMSYTVTDNHILTLKQTVSKYRKTYPEGSPRNPHGYGTKPTLVPIDYDQEKIHLMTVEQYHNMSKNMKRRYSGFSHKFLKIPRKRVNKKNNNRFNIHNTKIKTKPIGEGQYYGFEIDGDKMYMLEDGTVTHNSSKTYSILQLLIVLAIEKPRRISIVRKTLPALKKSAYRDFKDILNDNDIPYKENKSDSIITIGKSEIEFFSLDDEQKVRGSKRDILYINEANEINKLEYNQLVMRTTDTILVDYNPSDANHFIIKDIIPANDSILIKSTFLNNPFLEQSIIDHIMSYKYLDEDMWLVYGLGEIATGKDNVFSYKTFRSIDEVSDVKDLDFIGYGLDWGFTADPTALVAIWKSKDSVYLEQLIYESGLTNEDISERLKDLNVSRKEIIYADSAEPKSIEELKRLGHNVRPAKKGPDSIRAGIDVMKRFRIYIKGEDLINEFDNYKWKKDRNGEILNQPIDKYNHCFTGDTLITTIDGYKKMKDIKEGDLVLTSNAYNRVIKKFNNGIKQVFKYEIKTDTNYELLECTKYHKIKTNRGWIEIDKLQKGDVITQHKRLIQESVVLSTEKSNPSKQEVYDLMVENDHEYFANNTLVHNCIDAARYCIYMTNHNPNYRKYSLA